MNRVKSMNLAEEVRASGMGFVVGGPKVGDKFHFECSWCHELFDERDELEGHFVDKHKKG